MDFVKVMILVILLCVACVRCRPTTLKQNEDGGADLTRVVYEAKKISTRFTRRVLRSEEYLTESKEEKERKRLQKELMKRLSGKDDDGYVHPFGDYLY